MNKFIIKYLIGTKSVKNALLFVVFTYTVCIYSNRFLHSLFSCLNYYSNRTTAQLDSLSS